MIKSRTNSNNSKNIELFKEFFIVFVMGLFIHAPIFMHDILAWDDYGNILRESSVHELSLGRFIASLYKNVTSCLGFKNNITYYNIVLFIIFTAIGLILILNSLNIKEKVFRLIFSFIFLEAPSISYLTPYRHGIIFTGMVIMVVGGSLYLISINDFMNPLKNKKVLILSYILLIIAIGIGQSALATFTTILLLLLIDKIISGKENPIAILKVALIHLGLMILISVIYIGLMFLLNYIFELNNNYLEESFTVHDLQNALFRSYGRVFQHLFYNYRMSIGIFIKICYLAMYIVILFELYLIFKIKNINKLLLILFMFFLPVSMDLAMFMKPNGVPLRSSTNIIFIFIIPIFLYSKIKQYNINKGIELEKIIFVLLMSFSICFFYNIQDMYQNGMYGTQSSKAYAIEMVNRIRCIESYSTDKKLCFIGNPSAMDKTDYYGVYNFLDSSWSFIPALKNLAGFNFIEVDNITKQRLLEYDEIKNMSIYPESGSIKIIDNVIIVKISK